MDGLDSRVEVDLLNIDFDTLKFVEIKTLVNSSGAPMNMRWWAQSYLANISNITVGYRTLDGIVYKVDSVPVGMLTYWRKVISKIKIRGSMKHSLFD